MATQSTRGAPDELEKFIERDLTALAKAGKLRAAYGVDAAVTEVSALQVRGGKAPLLAGDAGVGKTAIVEEFARRAADGRAGEELGKARIVEVPVAGIFARTSTPRQAAELCEELLESLARSPGTIVYVRDAALIPNTSLSPVFIRVLRAGNPRFIFEAELKRAQELVGVDEVFSERLHLLVVTEPPPELARWIVGRVAEDLEAELKLRIDPAACDMALRLATRFVLSRRLPRKAIELLREAATEAAGAAADRLGPEHVLERFCATTRLPRFIVDDAMPLDLAETERFFAERLLGQSDAVAAVLRAVALVKAGLNDPRRPLGVFLFAGPTGVGKTHMAKLLAEYLFGSAERLFRLNMADYPNEGDELTVFGSPWAQPLDARRGELTRLLSGKLFAVLLLDEFEKAHASCHDRFLQLFDEGQFINANGETVPCQNTLIVATTNIGADVYREPPMGFAGTRSEEQLIAEVDRRIADAFRPEFLNRFDAICHFRPLGKVEIRRIAQREVGHVLEREGIRTRNLEVEVSPEVVDLLVERGYSPHFGARFLQREIEKTLTNALAVEVAKRPMSAGAAVRVVARTGGKVVALTEGPAATREARTPVALPGAGAAIARRRLDRRELAAETDALVQRAEALVMASGKPSLEENRAKLLAAMQAPGFWDDAAQAASMLRAFRQVDAHLNALDALVRNCVYASRRAHSAKSEAELLAAVPIVEEAALAVQLAQARAAAGAGTDADEALIEICAAGEGPANGTWVSALAKMYLLWAEKRGCDASAIAEAESPSRAVLRITGPGVRGFLAGEAGVHRRIEDARRISAFVRIHHLNADPPAHIVVDQREVKRRPGEFVERVGVEATARDDSTGRVIRLALAEGVDHQRSIAASMLRAPVDDHEARRYHVGRGAHVEDPRTGAGTPRVKEVLRGELDLFIAAWLARPPAERPAPEHPLA
jgi:ATP-dependent Clp protease ATP-binding subunit ClpC